MKISRKSSSVFFGRLFQSIPTYLISWLEIFFKKGHVKRYPLIILVSPPRSGSTLTYQILSRGAIALYLTNLWNVLYAIPIIGGLLSINSKSKRRNFTSNRGLVAGMYGESEGLKFWDHWTSQGLEESMNRLSVSKIKYIRKVFGRLTSKDYPMVTAYLGHSLSIDKLRKIFPGCMFIYLKRDKLSNIYSMYNVGKEFSWFSLKPKGWQETLSMSKHERFVWQYNTIVNKIEREIKESDTLIVNYEDICSDPHDFLRNVQDFAKNKQINVRLDLENIPNRFEVSKISSSYDPDSKKIYDIIKDE